MCDPKNIKIEDFDYPLPDERIAKYPVKVRDESKLLVYKNGKPVTSVFKNIAEELDSDSFVVFNNTKVVQARLLFKKETGAEVEVFCLEPWTPADYQQNFAATGGCEWKCLVGNAKRWKNEKLSMAFGGNGTETVLCAEKTGKTEDGFVVRFTWNGNSTFSEILEAAGRLPIPPYLNRAAEESDKRTYQTVYGKIEGSVAAPTAGLHFTPEVFARLAAKGIGTAEVTLHVGAGTFRPVKSELIGDHVMHCEHIKVDRKTVENIKNHLGHIVAVGTTSVRTLESLYHIGCALAAGGSCEMLSQWAAYENPAEIPPEESLQAVIDYMDAEGLPFFSAGTSIIIAPGYRFRIVDSMITNFHQPKSTLLLLLAAFVGDDWRKIYKFALDNSYRFLSYGDSSLLYRSK